MIITGSVRVRTNLKNQFILKMYQEMKNDVIYVIFAAKKETFKHGCTVHSHGKSNRHNRLLAFATNYLAAKVCILHLLFSVVLSQKISLV